MQILEQSSNATIATFTGADLKEWYKEKGENYVYICHVVSKKMCEILGRQRKTLTVTSQDMIGELRRAVPARFRAHPSLSSVVERHMLQKFCSNASHADFRTRQNLIRQVPDDFEFKIKFYECY